MGTNRRPFQIASRVLLVAFILSLAVVLSNPQAVRLAILAKSQPETPVRSEGVAILAANAQQSPTAEGPRAEVADQADDEPAAREPTLSRQPTLVAQAPVPPEPANAVQLPDPPEHPEANASPDFGNSPRTADGALNAQRISSAADGFSPSSTDAGTPVLGQTMPIVSPATLQGPDQRGEYYELPPPPGWEDNPVSLSESVALGPSVTDDWSEPASPSAAAVDWRQQDAIDARAAQERLEAEIADLRREIGHLTESQQIGSQLDRLQRGQQELLHLHQELPVDRMIQLLDLLTAELRSAREAIPQPSRPLPMGGPHLEGEALQGAGGRVSLRITDAELEDVLRMFSMLSGKSVVMESEADRRAEDKRTPGASFEKMSAPTTSDVSPATTSPPLTAPNFQETPAAEFSLPVPGKARPLPLSSAQSAQHQIERKMAPQRVRQTAWSSHCVACHSRRATR